jgi:hypothetical protein
MVLDAVKALMPAIQRERQRGLVVATVGDRPWHPVVWQAKVPGMAFDAASWRAALSQHPNDQG